MQSNRVPWPAEFEDVLGAHLAERPAPGALAPDLDLEDAGIDSVTVIGLMVELETRFSFTFPDELLTNDTFATPENLWKAIASQLS
ncbi:acyl carrier protein [Saccharothrix tamanrassetensis]|uniref:Acyl carrier protein n=1 Tax=Saccharothrix tamanrassetensis TaxID=1051531 RepID=A0A841CQA3_9PSEU|nr:phosphopantetheine-binding protein [Saccharothrix tamanrassetensis]MBB5960592.1 acyl carrier protein [Saccharothrix tamanrassetensis]